MSDDAYAGLTPEVRTVCDLVLSTVGPFGANKLLLDRTGTVTTTSVGSLVLEQVDVANPSVTLLERAAADFRQQHGDGTSTVVALTGALLDEAEDLIEMGIHPTTIERGYREALAVADDRIDQRSHPVSEFGLHAVARSALTSVRDPWIRDQVSASVAEVASTLFETYGPDAFDHDHVHIVSRIGGALNETELVEGVVLDSSRVVETMPRSVEGGIALLSSTVDLETIGSEVDRTSGVSLSLRIDSFEEHTAIGERERTEFDEALSAAVDDGCRAIVTTRAVNDRVKRQLANNGILALQRVDESEFRRLARLTGATVVPKLDFVSADTLGRATVSTERTAGRDMTRVESDAGEPIYTLFCRAPDPRSTDSFERTVENAIAATTAAVRSGGVVAGGGATEIAAAHAVRRSSRGIDSREQFAVEAFADALSVVPRCLARNAGMDVLETLTRLHVAHSEGRHVVGVDAFDGALRDVTDGETVVDPTASKRAILAAATDLCVKLLRIDERVHANDLTTEEANPEDAERSPLPEAYRN